MWIVHPEHALVSPTSFRIMAHDCSCLFKHHAITYNCDFMTTASELIDVQHFLSGMNLSAFAAALHICTS